MEVITLQSIITRDVQAQSRPTTQALFLSRLKQVVEADSRLAVALELASPIELEST